MFAVSSQLITCGTGNRISAHCVVMSPSDVLFCFSNVLYHSLVRYALLPVNMRNMVQQRLEKFFHDVLAKWKRLTRSQCVVSGLLSTHTRVDYLNAHRWLSCWFGNRNTRFKCTLIFWGQHYLRYTPFDTNTWLRFRWRFSTLGNRIVGSPHSKM